MPEKLPTKLLSADTPGFGPADLPFVGSAGGGSGGGITLLLHFDYNSDPAGTDALAVTPVVDNTAAGTGWNAFGSYVAGNLQINNGAELGTQSVASEYAGVSADAGEFPYIVKLELRAGAYAAFRMVDQNSFWYIFHDGTNGLLLIYERTGGSNTLRASGATTSSDQTSPFYVTDTGTEITINRPDDPGFTAPISYASTSHNSSTLVGIPTIFTGRRHDNYYLYTGTADYTELPT
jgi:hypothetical protein